MNKAYSKLQGQKDQINFRTKNASISRSEFTLGTLLSYADIDDAFRVWFQDLVSSFPKIAGRAHENPHPTATSTDKIFLPSDLDTATRRAYFLMKVLSEDETSETEKTLQKLSAWIKENPREDPRVQVIGLQIGWIVGPTFGRIHKKKKMHYVAREALYKKTNTDFARAVSEVNAQIIRKTLELSGGKTDRFEPEMGDWIYGEREACFYEANDRALSLLHQKLQKNPVPYAYTGSDTNIELMAISPSISEHELETLEGVSLYEE